MKHACLCANVFSIGILAASAEISAARSCVEGALGLGSVHFLSEADAIQMFGGLDSSHCQEQYCCNADSYHYSHHESD